MEDRNEEKGKFSAVCGIEKKIYSKRGSQNVE